MPLNSKNYHYNFELVFVDLRYYLEGDRPSQTNRFTIFPNMVSFLSKFEWYFSLVYVVNKLRHN